MNNNYENSNYLCNYYDSNYYNSFNQTNERRFDSLYENYLNSFPNIDYKIASNIASNYRQCGSGWASTWGYPQTGINPYYESNYSYNRLEPLNEYQTLPSDEVEYHNEFTYSDIQSHNYLDRADKAYENTLFKSNLDNLIPLTVQEVEKQIKTEKEIVEIIGNERQERQTDCFQIQEEIESYKSCESFEYKENSSLNDNTIESLIISEPKRRRNRKLMSYEELKRDKRESNRLAATKCRQKKLYQLQGLNKRSKLLVDENDKLEKRLNDMKAQVFEKKLALIYHRNNGCLLNAFHT